MFDRASTFAQPEIVELLKTRFVPVAIDQACQRRQKDTEGEFYRKIASQGPRSDFNSTTQGFYIATPTGELMLYNNNRDPEKLLRLMKERLREYNLGAHSKTASAIVPKSIDKRYTLKPPQDGLVVRVQAKVLGGYETPKNSSREIFQKAVSRDNLWITADEHQQLAKGNIPESLQQRLARYHLVDNTRGEPPMWKPNEIRSLDMKLRDGVLTGSAHLETEDGKRGYETKLRGNIEVKSGKVVRFDVVSLGDFWGDGPYTRNPPEGRFPLAVTFRLADGSDVADPLPPQGARGWVDGYLK
ncbi:MAG: hypothetical protein ACR2NZ_19370 [Rubripirellula sp.]